MKDSHPVLAKDVHITTNKKKILFILGTSKTHWKNNKPQMVKITAVQHYKVSQKTIISDALVCPFTALKNFLNLGRGFTSKHEPFFIFRDGSPVTPDNFRNILKKTLVKAGFDERLYNSHSFCIGRSCDLLKMGVSVETIKKIGRWHGSNPVYTYLKFQ